MMFSSTWLVLRLSLSTAAILGKLRRQPVHKVYLDIQVSLATLVKRLLDRLALAVSVDTRAGVESLVTVALAVSVDTRVSVAFPDSPALVDIRAFPAILVSVDTLDGQVNLASVESPVTVDGVALAAIPDSLALAASPDTVAFRVIVDSLVLAANLDLGLQLPRLTPLLLTC